MKYWNKNLRDMAEYVPGEQPTNIEEYIKLNTNENPFPPSPAVLKALTTACNGNLRRYPNPDADEVRQIFASLNNMTPDNVFISNGSDELFTLIFRGFIDKSGRAAFSYPSYSLYYTMAEANGIKYDKINYKKDFTVDFQKFLEKEYDLVILCNPNNPTGVGINPKEIDKFLQVFKGLLVVDEAYVDFYGESAIGLVNKYENLLVTRSLSKSYSLAGLRVGIAAGHKDLITGLLKLKDSYNVDSLAQAGAAAALSDQKSFKYNLQMVRNNKEYLEERLNELDFTILPSKANFIFAKHDKLDSRKLYEDLKERKILVRHFKGAIQDEYIRITVGTMMEIKTLVKEIESLLKE